MTDAGTILLADAYGAARTIFVKDVDGVRADNSAEPLPRVSATSLLAEPADSLPIDPAALELMTNTKHTKEIQLISGLTRGNLTRALNREQVGTVIHA